MKQPSSLYLYFWAMFPLLFPFYVFPSGDPQPGDMVMAVLILIMVPALGGGVPRELRRPVIAGAWFVGYAAALTMVYLAMAVELSKVMLLSPVYYAYNLLAFGVAATLYSWFGHRFLRITLLSIAASITLQVAVALVLGNDPQGRDAVTFNNPNQLGHFALLCGTMVCLLATRVAIRAGWQALLLVGCLYLTALSLSKAAMFALAMLAVLVFVKRPLVALALALLLAVIYVRVEPADLIESVQTRIETPQTDETPATRGYDRLLKYPEYLVFGAAEGDYGRFESEVGMGEIHSSVGTLLFSYGVVGTSLFAGFIWAIYRRAGGRLMLYLLPLFFFGLTHQGLRFTLFWVALAITACVGDATRRARQVNRAAGAMPPRARGHPASQPVARSQARSPPD